MERLDGSDGTMRAGHYIRQPRGYRAFIPDPLPPDPPIRFDAQMADLLSEANRELGRLDGSILTLPAPDLFVFMYVRKEAVLSSQIEGTQSSLNDLLEAEARIMRPGRPRDVQEVINYVNAMNYGLARLSELPVSGRLIREIHARLLAGVRGREQRPGEFRETQNWIGPSGCTLAEATFVPPPAELVGPSMAELERFLHAKDDLPPLIRIGLAHAQFETIHPFLDGNGRVGRLLITLLLCEQGILQKPVLYISHYFKKHRSEYYERLQSIRDDGDWESWLRFFLRAVASVSNEAADTARRIVELRERHRNLIINDFGRVAANALVILESLYSQPIVTVNQIAERLGVTFTSANTLVTRLCRAGILEEITGQARNRVFRYSPYVELFHE